MVLRHVHGAHGLYKTISREAREESSQACREGEGGEEEEGKGAI